MENLSKLFDRIREGDLDLKVNEDGRTTLSDQPLFELRQYISALEAGYNRLRKAKELRARIDEAAARNFVERELGLRWDQIEAAKELYTAKKVECVVFAADSERYGNCPTCEAIVIESKNNSCNNCGQHLDWGAV